MANLANKYRPKTFEDVTEQKLVVDLIKSMCDDPNFNTRNFLLTGPAGTGKANPMYTKIFTPSGFVKMKNINVGDKVFTHTGAVGNVTGVFPQGTRDIYTIYLSDGSYIDVSDEHLNFFQRAHRGHFEDVVITTKDLIKTWKENPKDNWYSDPALLTWEENEAILIHPYVAGVLLGLWCAQSSGLENELDDNIVKIVSTILTNDWNLKASLSEEGYLCIKNVSTYTSSNEQQFYCACYSLLKAYSGSMEFAPHISDCYMRTSVRSRVLFVEGFYNTFRSKLGCTDSSKCFITFTSKRLAQEFIHLIRTLSGYVISSELGKITSIRFELPESLRCYATDKSSLFFFKDVTKRYIINIEYKGKDECQCIMVDHEDHTYICEDGLVCTHNTTLGRIMANYLNDGNGDVIELDAASNGSIDSLRQLIAEARTYPVGQKWKVFIIDECFHSDTRIKTSTGYKRIADIKVGDSVANLTGTSIVRNVFENKVKSDRLIKVYLSNGKELLTTLDHLFFTDDGWVCAKDLIKGDVLYDYKTMHNMQSTISSESVRYEENLQPTLRKDLQKATASEVFTDSETLRIYKNVSDMWEDLLHSSKCEFSNVFSRVCRQIEIGTRTFSETERFIFFAEVGLYLSELWKDYEDTKERSSEILLFKMCKCLQNATSSEEDVAREILFNMWKEVYSKISYNHNLQSEMQRNTEWINSERAKKQSSFNSYESLQSDVKSGYDFKDAENQGEEWDITSAICSAWRKRAVYKGTSYFKRSIRRQMDLRVSCEDTCSKDKSHALSYELQTRPSLSRFETRSRGGWDQPFYEIESIVRRKENQSAGIIRVESIEIYKRGSNEQSFNCYFTSDELHSGIVSMYDLEIEGHPSYYANDILVHNCHSISNTGWQTLLKTLEDQAGRSIFVFATTNPEKIPATILSRVQTFQLSKISLNGIVSRLKYVISKEVAEGNEITYTDDAISYVAKMANGGMRDSLTLLDKCLAFSKDVNIENVSKALNLPEYADFFTLLGAYAKKDNQTITEIVDKVYNSGVNFVKWFQNFHSFVINIVKYIYLQDISKTMIPSTYRDKISNYGPNHVIVCLTLANKLITMINELKTTQYLQEVALTHLCFLNVKK